MEGLCLHIIVLYSGLIDWLIVNQEKADYAYTLTFFYVYGILAASVLIEKSGKFESVYTIKFCDDCLWDSFGCSSNY